MTAPHPQDTVRRSGAMANAQRRMRRAWFRTNRTLGGGPTSVVRVRRLLAALSIVAFAAAFGLVLLARDEPRASTASQPNSIVAEQRTSAPAAATAPAPRMERVELKPTAALPAPLTPPRPKPRTRVTPTASTPASAAPAASVDPTPAATAAPAPAVTTPAPAAPTPRAQPQPTPAPTFDDSGDSGSFDLP